MESALCLLFTSFLFSAAGAFQYEAINNAMGTPGGNRFDSEIGLDYSKQVLADASSFIWTTFDQPSESERKPVQLMTVIVQSCTSYPAFTNTSNNRFDSEIGLDYCEQVLAEASSFIWTTLDQPSESYWKQVQLITLIIESKPNSVAYTSSDKIHLSAEYVAEYNGDVRTEVVGVLYHEATHVWQWNGRGDANGGLIEGIADYVRLKAGYAPEQWVGPGRGDWWDQEYDVTARFLDYCNGLSDGFVGRLNAKMRDGYSDSFFQDLLGKTVDQLWSEYKAMYNT